MQTRQPEQDDHRLTLRIRKPLWLRLRVAAAKRDQSTTALINDALEEWLARQPEPDKTN